MAAYASLQTKMRAAYAKAGVRSINGYQGWLNVAKAPYISDTHGGRYVNNYVDGHGDYRYAKYEDGGTMPLGTVMAKDSFIVKANGKAKMGPMFIMEKMASGFNKASGDWRYAMIMPNGKLFGQTKGVNAGAMKMCNDCHEAMKDQDYLWFLPEEDRS